jgi:hypothetical protein
MPDIFVKNSAANDIVVRNNGDGPPLYLNGSRPGDIVVRNTEEDILVILPSGVPGPPGPGIAEAPTDGKSYARANAEWTTALFGLSRTSFALGTVTANGATTIDWTAGELQTVTLTGNASFSVINWPATGALAKLVLQIKNTGAFNVTGWPSGTVWPGGVPPVITSGAGKTDVVVLMTPDAGATVLGSIVGQDYH